MTYIAEVRFHHTGRFYRLHCGSALERALAVISLSRWADVVRLSEE